MSERNRDHSQEGLNTEQQKDTHIDHLLQQTLKDDMPSDVENAMKEQLDQFRLKMERAATRTTSADRKFFKRMSQFESVRWAHFLLNKEVLVVVSLLMIVLGGYIQSSGSSNQLTENLSVLGTSVAVSSQMIRSHSMECSIQIHRDSQKPLNYLIQWLSPNLSKIQVIESENILLKTIWLSEDDIVIADYLKDRVYNESHSALRNDPVIQPIIGYLAPTELAEQMYGEWKFKQTEQKGECDEGTFTVLLPNKRALLEVSVDLCTFLPVTINKILPAEEQGEEKLILNVRYTWNVPLSPEHLSPKQTKESQKA